MPLTCTNFKPLFQTLPVTLTIGIRWDRLDLWDLVLAFSCLRQEQENGTILDAEQHE